MHNLSIDQNRYQSKSIDETGFCDFLSTSIGKVISQPISIANRWKLMLLSEFYMTFD